jgi:hypothetical protein
VPPAAPVRPLEDRPLLPSGKGTRVIQAATSTYGTQALTLAIPLGFFVVVLIWGFFQRRSPR